MKELSEASNEVKTMDDGRPTTSIAEIPEEGTTSTAAGSCVREGQEFGLLLRECLSAIESSIVTQDNRFIARMLRRIYVLKRLFNSATFLSFVNGILIPMERPRGEVLKNIFSFLEIPKNDSAIQDALMPSIDDPNPPGKMGGTNVWVYEPTKEYSEAIAEIDFFLSIISLMVLLDAGQHDSAKVLADSLIAQLSIFPQPKKYEDQILAKVMFWVSRVYDLQQNLASLRGILMSIYRTCVLHSRIVTQVVVLNTLLKSFAQDDLYDQAVQLLEKSVYPEKLRCNSQHARYLYYLARINAVRGNYSIAHSKIVLALGKGPQEGSPIGRGFRLTANKLYIITQLLMGETPERRLFHSKEMREAMIPYAEIVKAVRSGDLVVFQRVTEKYSHVFMKDRNWIFIQRLHYNVIRTGLRRITTSYIKISLDDVTSLLGLEKIGDTICIVAKAIDDGVIDAKIDVKSQILFSDANTDCKSFIDPRKALHSRISFCIQLYNEALKAMQYPEPSADSSIEEAEARRKEHQEQLARAEKEELDGGDGSDLI